MNNEASTELTYSASFLGPTEEPDSPALRIPPHDLRPPLVADKDEFYNGEDVGRIFWRGMCCPQCGRVNSREYFSHWECFGCGFRHGAPKTIYTAVQLADPHRSTFTGPPIIADWVKPDCEITSSQTIIGVPGGLIRVATYVFGETGRVIHLAPSAGAMGGADEMFIKYQTQDVPFRRYPMRSSKGCPL